MADEDEYYNSEHSDIDVEDDDMNDVKEVTMEELLTVNGGDNNVMDEDIYQDYLDTPKVSLNRLTKYEKTQILGIRIQQLSNGLLPYITIDNASNKEVSLSYIAQKELEERKLPFIIKRKISESITEYWRLSELLD